ncbi:MAG: hypothetical protein KF794_11520 [Xanthobacteraceae bacterium]|nr:hypothetical protein [Xanthobacteraceae bacterium]QYK44399.1 MAG: hypothetical protein KF794_11520 [Xanthobacteraceae bacterium]HMN52526.1 hypothetical protein [Xanthobacteraceae bacterium]
MILHKYIDQGGNAFANIEYAPKDRVLLSHTNTGFAVLRMIWGGRLPVKTLYSVHSLIMERMMRVLARDTSLPERPKGRYEKDEAAMAMFLDAAITDITAVGKGEAVPGAVEKLDLDNLPPRPIALLTRFAATAVSSADLIRKLERLQNIPG